MTTLAAVIDGITSTIEGAGWRVDGYAKDNPSPPCALVYPTSGNFEDTMGLGSDVWTIIVDLLWPTNSDRAAWTEAYAALDATGLRTALHESPQVGETGCDVVVTGVEMSQAANDQGVRYLMAQLTLRVLIDG